MTKEYYVLDEAPKKNAPKSRFLDPKVAEKNGVLNPQKRRTYVFKYQTPIKMTQEEAFALLDQYRHTGQLFLVNKKLEKIKAQRLVDTITDRNELLHLGVKYGVNGIGHKNDALRNMIQEAIYAGTKPLTDKYLKDRRDRQEKLKLLGMHISDYNNTCMAITEATQGDKSDEEFEKELNKLKNKKYKAATDYKAILRHLRVPVHHVNEEIKWIKHGDCPLIEKLTEAQYDEYVQELTEIGDIAGILNPKLVGWCNHSEPKQRVITGAILKFTKKGKITIRYEEEE